MRSDVSWDDGFGLGVGEKENVRVERPVYQTTACYVGESWEGEGFCLVITNQDEVSSDCFKLSTHRQLVFASFLK